MRYDSDQRRLLVKIVREAFGCEILEAEDGLEALKIIIQGKQVPNLILLDLMMPRLTGVEFLTIAQGRPEFDHVPVVICTALAETKEIRGKIGNHIHGYLVKPINKEKLLVKRVTKDGFLKRTKRKK
ncbi:response regulator [candidate division KSB1 bacterium]|nr:response regulator [candidate division KSB1 bacterium]